jgi:hypothetical protein
MPTLIRLILDFLTTMYHIMVIMWGYVRMLNIWYGLFDL